MRRFISRFAILLGAIWLMAFSTVAAQSNDEAVVRAVLFFSPTCSHCHKVINELILPMIEQYGDTLQIMGVDTTQEEGAALYQAAIERYQIPSPRRGVPTMVVGETVLVGSGEIPSQFPTIVEEGLAGEGIAWPDIPGFEPELAPAEEAESEPLPPEEAEPKEVEVTAPSAAENTDTAAVEATAVSASEETEAVPAEAAAEIPAGETKPESAEDTAPASTGGPASNLAEAAIPPIVEEAAGPSDPVGITLASAILGAMIVAIGFAAWRITGALDYLLQMYQLEHSLPSQLKTWLIPLLTLAGLGVAAYLSYVEITHVEAVCGPIGECNIVQSSVYATILGIPIAVLGMLNYLAIGILWVGQKFTNDRLANLSALSLLGLTLFGVLFSIYLTYLEIFVIQAVCLWCLSSAVITTVLMLAVLFPLTRVFSPNQKVHRASTA
jgi:uncharacterized membrane protein